MFTLYPGSEGTASAVPALTLKPVMTTVATNNVRPLKGPEF